MQNPCSKVCRVRWSLNSAVGSHVPSPVALWRGGVGKDTFSSSDRKTSSLALVPHNPPLNLDTFYWHTVWLALGSTNVGQSAHTLGVSMLPVCRLKDWRVRAECLATSGCTWPRLVLTLLPSPSSGGDLHVRGECAALLIAWFILTRRWC
ncbi:hypothetical protein L1887_61767 [Cichorium endivia]|nr:hypothetical protein L1887_61767 [Cichorium endivia]